MSKVKITRFVNVMLGGKDWWKEPLAKKDSKLASILAEIKSDFAFADDLRIADKKLKELRDEYESISREFYGGGGGISPAKFVEREGQLIKNAEKTAKNLAKLIADFVAKNAEPLMKDAIGAEEFADRSNRVNTRIEKTNARVDGLSETDKVAIRGYTLCFKGETDTAETDHPGEDADYVDMQRVYRNEARIRRNQGEKLEDVSGDLAKIKTKNLLMEQAMGRLPNYTGTQPTFRLDVYIYKQENGEKWRGWPAIYESLGVGGEWIVPAFWSTGKTGTIGSHAVEIINWTVHGKSGKDIDGLSAAEGEGGGEVLYPPRTKFKVLKKKIEIPPADTYPPRDKIYHLTVREIE